MGGYGSGCWSFSHKKTTVEECRSLDVRRFKREGMLQRGQVWSGQWCWWDEDGNRTSWMDLTTSAEAITLSYTIRWTYEDREPEDIRYTVRVVWTPCNFGGKRPWFICPGRDCGRRVAKLYMPPSAKYYLCRHCHDLSYRSRQRWDKRVAFYRQHPELVAAMLRRGEKVPTSKLLLALKAWEAWQL